MYKCGADKLLLNSPNIFPINFLLVIPLCRFSTVQ